MRLTSLSILFFATTVSSAAVVSVHDNSPADAAREAFAAPQMRDTVSKVSVTTSHTLNSGDEHLRYKATVNEWPVAGSKGEDVGVMVTEAYVAQTDDPASRPVTFVFNGGPGSSSWALQMEGIGPVVFDPVRGQLLDNPDSILDATDLVFIDPLGTGASFPLKGKDATAIWNVGGDAESITVVMADWLKNNGRTHSPQFILGESYGTLRTLAILNGDAKTRRLNLSGVALLSLFIGGLQDDNLKATALMPSLAAAAYAHGVRKLPAATVEDAYASALEFARNRYLPALLQGNHLDVKVRDAVAAEMSEQTGVAQATLEQSNLRISQDAFSRAFALPNSYTHIGNLDTRLIGTKAMDALPRPYNDPGMTLGRRPSKWMDDYLASLGYHIAAPYRALDLYINRHYWSFSNTPMPRQDSPDTLDAVSWLADAMKRDSRLRLFTAGGYFDTNTPLFDGEYVLENASIDPARWTSKAYASGHTITDDPVARTQLAADLRRFIKIENAAAVLPEKQTQE